ncbi:cation-translocating P-type ATPase [Chryseobacterium sp. MFBS3-17]|uniref:cation-translocating P-type ATPase n=1 Tax=Chryseobacterium sp. MFBS3-17 TaxID=2886689 RepID=UPI001D0DE862|nr:cation-translocating P-type ATPase [Chryseobacterium sp. MFBS3-17]MCC2589450.1 cation-translocating P-type ATPase [Chryseobacterium sp. MFBS3-17]
MNEPKTQGPLYYAQTADQILKEKEVNPETGLKENEVAARISEYGPNKLQEQKRKSIFRIFLAQLNNALIYVLMGAVIITMLMGEYTDGIIISTVIFINAALGVIQEVKAGNAIDALRDMAAPKAVVRRDGHTRELNSEDLVPGDIVLLDAGRYIPADLRLIESANLKIDESALTGESVAVEKDAEYIFSEEYIALGDRKNLAFMGTLITYGRGTGVVTGTGKNTEVGHIAHLLSQDQETRTPLELRLDRLGKMLGIGAIVICVVIFVLSYFQGRNLAEMFLTSVSLAVAAIPEGLAAIVAVVLSIGVTRMAKKKAIIKKLPAVETLGSVNIVCSDKTGTLTQNKMTVNEIFTFTDGVKSLDQAISDEGILLAEAMVLASDATLEDGESTGDPTEIALLQLADDLGIDRNELHAAQPRKDELAFDSDRKMMSTLHEKEGKHLIYVKGALGSIMKHASGIILNGQKQPVTDDHISQLRKAAESMSDKALRTLAVAYKEVDSSIAHADFEKDLVIIGITGMMDPPRDEVKESIALAQQAGITTVMITGDHKNTAFAIARDLGIATDISQATTGGNLSRMSRTELEKSISGYRVFARVSPEHKVKIIKALKSRGNIVSMTGDGVNDAPSLNAADIGVAMGITGTDAAKNASDMILADDNFSTIITAVEQGRNIYNNIKKAVVFLLACNVGEVLVMLAAILGGLPVPLSATQLLWINLVTDTLPAVALGMDPGDKDIMKEKPRTLNENFFSHGAGRRIILAGFLISALTMVAFLLGYHLRGFSAFAADIPEEVHEYARTLAFLTIITCQLFYSFALRSEYKSIFKVGVFSNKYLVGAVIFGLVIQLMVLYIPFMKEAFKLQYLNLNDWLMVLGLGLIPLAANEILKIFTGQKHRIGNA